jgi:hypothetical protein
MLRFQHSTLALYAVFLYEMDHVFAWNGFTSDPFPGPFTLKEAFSGSDASPPSPLFTVSAPGFRSSE